MKLLIGILCLVLSGCSVAMASEVYIDLERIAQIESGANPGAYNRSSGAVGMYQITDSALADFNQLTGIHYGPSDMYDPQKSARVANWYLNERIPALLRRYRLKDGVDTRLWAYNAGIGQILRGFMPLETRGYIAKYHKLEKGK